MKRFFPTAWLPKAAFAIVLGAASLHAAAGTNKTEVVDVARLLNAARESAVHVPSLFMSQQEKIETVEAFVKIIETVSDSNEVLSATNGSSGSAYRKYLAEQYYPAWLEIARLNDAKKDVRPAWLSLLADLKNRFPEDAPAWSSYEKYDNKTIVEDGKIDTDYVFILKNKHLEKLAVSDVLRQRLLLLGGREIICNRLDPQGPLKVRTNFPITNAPFNLVVEIPATKDFENKPTVILNAHMDAIAAYRGYSPDWMDFDAKTREFFHRRGWSFGADDRAGVMTILRALEMAKSGYWDKGAGHRRFLIILTVQEEYNCIGSQYLAKYYPELFENVEILLVNDGPLDFDEPALYPRDSFIVVADEEMRYAPPYRNIIDWTGEVCNLKHASFAKTTLGLGMGDDGCFPVQAHTSLHIRAPYQGDHEKERVKLDDLFNHIDLFTYIILRLDGTPLNSRS